MEKQQRLNEIAKRLENCQLCPLSTGRNKIVMGQGDPNASLVFVGEAPGEAEDQSGLAFVGRAGQLLTKLLAEIDLVREKVFIANINKCRPPNNRPPTPQERDTCIPFLREQLEVIQPKAICALGKTAAIGLGLMDADAALNTVRGTFQVWNKIPVLVTYHPSYLLRSPASKQVALADLQKLLPYIKDK